MRKIQDRIVLRLPVDAATRSACGCRPAGQTPSRPTSPTGANCAGSPNSTSVGKISRRSSSCRSSSIEDSSTKPMSNGSSRRFQPLMKSLPRRPAAASAPGIEATRLIKRKGAVQRQFGQPFDHRARALPGQPFGDLLILRVVDRGVQDAVDRGRRNAAQAQHRSRLVGRRQNGQRPAILAPRRPRNRPKPDQPRPPPTPCKGWPAAWSCPTRPCPPPPEPRPCPRRAGSACRSSRSTPMPNSSAATRS